MVAEKTLPPLLARRKARGLEDNQGNEPREIGGVHSRPSCSATLHQFMVMVSRALAIQGTLHSCSGGTDQCGFLVKATLQTREPRGALIESSSFPLWVAELPKTVCLCPRTGSEWVLKVCLASHLPLTSRKSEGEAKMQAALFEPGSSVGPPDRCQAGPCTERGAWERQPEIVRLQSVQQGFGHGSVTRSAEVLSVIEPQCNSYPA